jgi:hypothetical protein
MQTRHHINTPKCISDSLKVGHQPKPHGEQLTKVVLCHPNPINYVIDNPRRDSVGGGIVSATINKCNIGKGNFFKDSWGGTRHST